MKSSLLKIALCAGLISSLTLPANANTCSYPLRHYINQQTGQPANSERSLTSLKIYTVGTQTSDVLNVNQGTTNDVDPTYFDKTQEETVFKFEPGAEIQFEVNWIGSWMHGYFYIDYDRDGEYNTTENSDGTSDGELVSYSFYSSTETANGKNSKGQSLSNNGLGVVGQMPNFTLPSNIKPGKYTALFKIDWNSLDPCGNSKTGNQIQNNAGCAVEFTIEIPAPEPEITIANASVEVDDETAPTQATVTADVTVENLGDYELKVYYIVNEEEEVEMELSSENTYEAVISLEGYEAGEYDVVVKATVGDGEEVYAEEETEAGSFEIPVTPTIAIGDYTVVMDNEENPSQITVTVTGVAGEAIDDAEVCVCHKLDDGEYVPMDYFEDGDKYEVIIPVDGLTAGTHSISVRAKATKDDCEIACHEMEKVATFVVPESTTTGLESISMENIDENTRFYNLQGVQVKNPSNGVYIMVNGDKATKVLIK